MPKICEFYGVTIAMFYNDHEPAHFHATYGGDLAVIGVDPVVVLKGGLPRRALGLVFEWARSHQPELQENWARARAHRPLSRIEPLE
ncbi:MAG: DUF4160 domain-containing protein [SAR202 cluster bacterium]|nr:DUF4160 domain-containing protein [SAR202 cluster bacterium]